jgi:hypothetical protein
MAWRKQQVGLPRLGLAAAMPVGPSGRIWRGMHLGSEGVTALLHLRALQAVLYDVVVDGLLGLRNIFLTASIANYSRNQRRQPSISALALASSHRNHSKLDHVHKGQNEIIICAVPQCSRLLRPLRDSSPASS